MTRIALFVAAFLILLGRPLGAEESPSPLGDGSPNPPPAEAEKGVSAAEEDNLPAPSSSNQEAPPISEPSVVPPEVAIYPFDVQNMSADQKAEFLSWVQSGISESKHESCTYLHPTDFGPDSKWTEEKLQKSAGDPESFLDHARQVKARWLLTGLVTSEKGYPEVEILFADVQSGEILKDINYKADSFESLKAATVQTVKGLFVASAPIAAEPTPKPVTEKKEAPTPKAETSTKTTPSGSGERIGYEASEWTLFGLALVSGGLGTMFAIFAQQDADAYNRKFAKDAVIDTKLKDKALFNSRLATGLWAAGGGLLGVSLVIFILDWTNTGEPYYGFSPTVAPDQVGAAFYVRY